MDVVAGPEPPSGERCSSERPPRLATAQRAERVAGRVARTRDL